MSLTHAVTTMMTLKLEKLGYPTHDIRWSLGYCQGDGASFTGKLDLKALGARLLPDINPAVWENADLDLELTRSGHYVHERSTSLNYDVQCIQGHDPDELGGAAQKVALGRLLAVLEEDVIAAGHSMASDGYKILESYINEEEIVREYLTDNFSVKVSVCADHDSDPFDLCDETCLQSVIDSYLTESLTIGGIKVVISQLDEDGEDFAELSSVYLGGCEWQRNTSVLQTPYVRKVMSEAVSEARAYFASVKRPTLKQAA